MAWVHKQNAVTMGSIGKDPGFAKVEGGIREVLDSKEKIPYVTRRGKYLYNFWTDAEHPHGLWRRTTLREYRKAHPKWQVLLDVDALGKKEHQSWVFHGVECLKPRYRRCLVQLSPGGSDAEVIREMDVEDPQLREGRLRPPRGEERGGLDRQGPHLRGHRLRQGLDDRLELPGDHEDLDARHPAGEGAKKIYEVKHTDLAAGAWRDLTPGYKRDFVERQIDFWKSETFLRKKDGSLQKIDVPLDANLGVERQWLTIELRTPWKVGGKTYPAGALLATNFDAFMKGERHLTVLFEPDGHTFLSSTSWTRHHLLLNEMHDVASRIEVLTPRRKGAWERRPLGGAPKLATLVANAIDLDHSDAYFLTQEGFLHPTTLARGVVGHGRGEDPQAHPGVLRRLQGPGAAVLRHLQGRHPGPLLRGGAQGPEARRHQPDAALRLRRLRGLPAAVLQRHRGPLLARPRRRLRGGQHPRRGRVRPQVARGGAQGAPAARLPGLRRGGPRPHRPEDHLARSTWPARAGATGGCSSATC